MTAPSRFKFRVWDGVAFHLWDTQNPGNYNTDKHVEIRRYPPHYVLQQSTGLLDKNGVEIFEGDMFRYTNERGESATLEVVWFEHGWYGALPGCKDDHEYDYEIPLWNIPKEYEVIGNIYANPEIK